MLGRASARSWACGGSAQAGNSSATSNLRKRLGETFALGEFTWKHPAVRPRAFQTKPSRVNKMVNDFCCKLKVGLQKEKNRFSVQSPMSFWWKEASSAGSMAGTPIRWDAHPPIPLLSPPCCSQLEVLRVSAEGLFQPKCRLRRGSQLRVVGLGGRRPGYNPFAEQT